MAGRAARRLTPALCSASFVLSAWQSCRFCGATKVIDPKPKQQVEEGHDRAHRTASLTLWPAHHRAHKSPDGPKSRKGNDHQDDLSPLLSGHERKQAQRRIAECDDGKDGQNVGHRGDGSRAKGVRHANAKEHRKHRKEGRAKADDCKTPCRDHVTPSRWRLRKGCTNDGGDQDSANCRPI